MSVAVAKSGQCGGERDFSDFPRFFSWVDYDLNIAVECSKKSHEPVNGIFTESPFEHARYLGLTNAHKFSGLGLRKFALIGETIYLRHDLCLEEMRFCIRPSQIGEDILAASYDIDFSDHGFFSFNHSA